MSAEVTFVHFDFSSKGSLGFHHLADELSEPMKIIGSRVLVNPDQGSGGACRGSGHKMLDETILLVATQSAFSHLAILALFALSRTAPYVIFAQKDHFGRESIVMNSLSSFIEKLEAIKQNIYRAGLSIHPSSRLSSHESQLRTLSNPGTKLDAKDFLYVSNCIRDIEELGVILDVFVRPIETIEKIVIEKLKIILGGQPLPATETNALARNTQYELFLAAFLAKKGFSVSLQEPDVLVRVDKSEAGIAAKRLISPKKVKERIKSGNQQISRSNLPGLIGLSIEQVVNPDLWAFVYTDEEQLDLIPIHLRNEFVEKYRESLNYMCSLTAGILISFWYWAIPKSLAVSNVDTEKVTWVTGWEFMFHRNSAAAHRSLVDVLHSRINKPLLYKDLVDRGLAPKQL